MAAGAGDLIATTGTSLTLYPSTGSQPVEVIACLTIQSGDLKPEYGGPLATRKAHAIMHATVTPRTGDLVQAQDSTQWLVVSVCRSPLESAFRVEMDEIQQNNG